VALASGAGFLIKRHLVDLLLNLVFGLAQRSLDAAIAVRSCAVQSKGNGQRFWW
jgi:hypothetical protein